MDFQRSSRRATGWKRKEHGREFPYARAEALTFSRTHHGEQQEQNSILQKGQRPTSGKDAGNGGAFEPFLLLVNN